MRLCMTMRPIGSAFLDMFFEVGPSMFAKPLIPRYASKQLGFT